jgi:hypothetical protein
MNSKIDFKKLDKTGAEFESLVRDLIEAIKPSSRS